MNGISLHNTNYSTPLRSQNIAFKGQLGDDYVNKIEKGDSVNTNTIIKDVKGAFGLKTEKVTDILDSFINKLKELTTKIKNQEFQLNQEKEKNNNLQKELEKQNEIYQARYKTLNEKEAHIGKILKEKDAEVAEAKEFAAKYNLAANIKSITDIDSVMPDEAIATIKQMEENELIARKSMVDFLLTGKGQEEAMKQIERNNIMYKAYCDGITKIPNVEKELIQTNKEKHLGICLAPRAYILHLLCNALYGSEKGSYLNSLKFKDQVLNNAMALLQPHCEDKYWNTSLESTKQSLSKDLARIATFHKKLDSNLNVIEKELKSNGVQITKINKLDGNINDKCIEYTFKDKPSSISFALVANRY